MKSPVGVEKVGWKELVLTASVGFSSVFFFLRLGDSRHNGSQRLVKETHQPFDVLRCCSQEELLANELQSA